VYICKIFKHEYSNPPAHNTFCVSALIFVSILQPIRHSTGLLQVLTAVQNSELFVEDEALPSGWQYEETHYSNLQMYRFMGARKRYGHILFKMEYTAYTLILTGLYFGDLV
jgi:hypothetical protein